MQQWYLLQSKPLKEQVAVENLQRQEYQIYLPLLQIRKRVRGHWREVIEPLFPRYIFIFLDNETQNWAPIRSTIGVSSLVRFGGEAAVVPEAVVHDLRAREDSTGVISLLTQKQFKAGDKLRIAEGPMQALEAVFSSMSGADRALVLIKILGQLRQVEIHIDQLLPA